ncbi:hypothetical protein JW935_15850 [candidate division KSB1 bacterium]|nr:hypothetical protein [candidate division KSB1 bacterium]
MDTWICSQCGKEFKKVVRHINSPAGGKICLDCLSNVMTANTNRHFSMNKCSNCGAKITRKAPVSPMEGMKIGQKFASGQVTRIDVETFYKSIGNNCPSCGKMICAFCFDNSGKKCPSCGSTIKYFS